MIAASICIYGIFVFPTEEEEDVALGIHTYGPIHSISLICCAFLLIQLLINPNQQLWAKQLVVDNQRSANQLRAGKLSQNQVINLLII